MDVMQGVHGGSLISMTVHDYVWLLVVLGLVSLPKYTLLKVVLYDDLFSGIGLAL